MRRLGFVRAGLANLAGFGLGYVYVGQIRFAFIFLAALFGTVAVAGWTRLVFQPESLYFVAVVVLSIWLFPVFHSAQIAIRAKTAVTKKYNRWWFYLFWVIMSWVLGQAILPSRAILFGFEPFSIPSSSMAPALERGDFIMADTWRYSRVEPSYDELVVFKVPNNQDVKYVFRVIGLPGDRIEIRNDVLFRNDEAVEESYLNLSPGAHNVRRNYDSVTVPAQHYFLLGDNRHNARDSRYLGPIERSLIHGRVEHRWFAYDGGVSWARFPVRIANDETE